jgi:hypothetical protein
MHPKQKGEITEQIIICEFLKLGIPVSKPIGDNQPYDLIIDLHGKLLKVQSRTGRLRNNIVKFNALSYRVNTKCVYMKDNRDKFDLFVVYCPDNQQTYIIESNKIITNVGRFYLGETHKILMLAQDNELDKWIKRNYIGS